MARQSARELVYRNAVVAVLADGRLDRLERPFLDRVRVLLGVERGEANTWMKDVAGGRLSVVMPEGQAERGYCLDVMIAACKADGRVSPEELGLLRSVAKFIGVSRAELDRRLGSVDVGGLRSFAESVAAPLLRSASTAAQAASSASSSGFSRA